MAFDLTQLQSATDDYVEKTPIDVYFDDNVLLYMLMSGGKFQDNLVSPGDLVDGGEKIKIMLEYAKANSGTYGNTTKIPQSKVDIINAARFRWAGAYSANTIDLDEKVQNSGKAAVVDLAFAKLRNIQKTIRDDMGTNIYSAAADSDSILGLGDLFETTSSTAYGSVKEDDMADWVANVITTAEAISFKVMQTIKRTAKVGQNKMAKPNLYITTDTLKDGFERTLQVQARYSDTKMVDAGFDNVLFAGVPVVADDKQSEGIVDALNLRYLSLKTHSDYKFTAPKWEYSKDQPDTYTANVRWIGQLCCSNRKAHCRHSGLTDPT